MHPPKPYSKMPRILFCLLAVLQFAAARAFASTAAFVRADRSTQGNWRNAYGANGFAVASNVTWFSSSAARVNLGALPTPSWGIRTNLPGALMLTSDTIGTNQTAYNALDRIVAAWVNPTRLSFNLDMSASIGRRLTVYCLDWGSGGTRSQRVSLVDTNTGLPILDTGTGLPASVDLSNFSRGAYLVWDVIGPARVEVTRLAGPDAVVSGIFLDRGPFPKNTNAPAFGLPEEQPRGVSLNGGDTAALAAGSLGEPPLSFQWLHNGSPVAGGTSPTLIVPNANALTAGHYQLILANAFGASTSQVATVTVAGSGLWKSPRLDLNGDGTNDIVWQDLATTTVGSWLLPANTWEWIAPGYNGNWRLVTVVDANNDGINDLIWQDAATLQVGSWLMPARTWHWLAPNPTGRWLVAGSLDVNGDGVADLLWQDSEDGRVGAWLMPGKTFQWISSVGNAPWKIVAVLDVDGDGKDDLVWRSAATAQVGAWLMPSKTWQWVSPGDNGAWKVVGAADVNGDGRADLLWQSSTTTGVGAWLMPSKAWYWVSPGNNGNFRINGRTP